MGIPTTIDTELPISKFGNETLPYTIVAKGTMWTLFMSDGAVRLREIDAASSIVYRLNENKPTDFNVSQAIIGGVISTTKFLIWTVEAEELYAEIIEPFVGSPPVKSFRTLIDVGITSVSAILSVEDGIRVTAIDKTLSNRGLVFKTFKNNITDTVGIDEIFPWPVTRLSQISAQEASSPHAFYPVYMDTASPPNVYQEITELPPPVFNPVEIRSFDTSSVDVRVQIDKDGIAYLVILADGATAPSSSQVKLGQDATSTPVALGRAANVALIADVENLAGTFIGTGLSPNTDYDIYVVAEDEFDNIQATPTLLNITTTLNPQIYFVSASGSSTPPYSNPANAHTSISALISALGGLFPGDIIEVVKAGDIIELLTVDPTSDGITIRSYGTNGTDRQSSKPIIKCSAAKIFDSKTGGYTNFVVKDLEIIPQPGCSRAYEGLSGEFRGNIIKGQNASSGASMVYAEYGFKGRNNLFNNIPDSAFIIDDAGGEGTESSVLSNTMYGFNGPAIRVEAGTVYAYNNNIHGLGVVGTKGLSQA